MKTRRILKTAMLTAALSIVAECGTGIDLGNVYDVLGSESAFDIGYKKIGAIYHDEYGMMNWYQYAYDENGVLISERCNSYDFGSYTETMYHENGQKESELFYDDAGNVTTGMIYAYNEHADLISVKGYLETDSMFDEEYRYDYDSEGKKLIKYKKNVNTPDWIVSSEYLYHIEGYLEKEIVHYEWSDTCMEEYTYDAAGNVIETIYNDDFTGQSYSYKEYDENGTLLTMTSFTQMDGVETTFQYENEYDAAGNLISSFNFYPDGTVGTSMENVYAVVDRPGEYYSLDEIYSYQDIMLNGDTFYKEFSQEEIFAQIEERIYAGDTIFTFGYKSPAYMNLNDVSLWETGNDTYGDYMKVGLRYDSSYGDFEIWGKVYYVINGNSVILTKCEDNVAANAENPTLDLRTLPVDPFVTAHLFSGNYYYQMERDEFGKFNVVDGEKILFDTFGAFNYVVNDQVCANGEYMTDPSDQYIDVHNYDFTLTFCVNGLCDTYYCRTLEEKEVIYICDYDVETDTIVSHETWVCENRIHDEELIKRLTYAE